MKFKSQQLIEIYFDTLIYLSLFLLHFPIKEKQLIENTQKRHDISNMGVDITCICIFYYLTVFLRYIYILGSCNNL